MLETLLKILSWDLPSPEILLEEDGDICLDWHDYSDQPTKNGNLSVSINKNGGVSWAGNGKHGRNIDELEKLLGVSR